MIISSNMVINKKTNQKYKVCFTVCLFLLKFVGSMQDLATTSIISSHVTTESLIILFKYLLFSQTFFKQTMLYWIFALTSTQFFIPLLILITFSTIKFKFTVA